MEKKPMRDLPAVVLAALIPANFLHLGWTYWLLDEQIETGWGGGTGLEMMALALWMLEALCVPVLALGVIYFVLSCYRRQKKKMLVSNIFLFAALAAQIVVTNLFLFY
jgi:hypothetical protein